MPDASSPDTRREAPRAELLAGTPYRALGQLGRGGMGDVFEAEHLGLGKRVVVKLLHATWAAHPALVDRLRLEAQALARIQHPNVVAATDLGLTSGGRPFLVMERLAGRTLKDELAARGPLPIREAVAFARDTLAGLSAAHALGIVHRDVKLDNLFLCDPDPEGMRRVKLLDFGIAKVLLGASSAPSPLAFPTEEGVTVGTPRFFSPEQALGRPVDARTDVYATGVVLYTLLTGRGPFDDASGLVELTRAHVERAPSPPSVHRRETPPELDRAILTALAKDPAARHASAEAFAHALEAASYALGRGDGAPRRDVGPDSVAPEAERAATAGPMTPAPLAMLRPVFGYAAPSSNEPEPRARTPEREAAARGMPSIVIVARPRRSRARARFAFAVAVATVAVASVAFVLLTLVLK